MKFTNEQNEAINSVDKNTIVSASAGSGKTTIMMERMSRLMSGEIVNKPVAVQTVPTIADDEIVRNGIATVVDTARVLNLL